VLLAQVFNLFFESNRYLQQVQALGLLHPDSGYKQRARSVPLRKHLHLDHSSVCCSLHFPLIFVATAFGSSPFGQTTSTFGTTSAPAFGSSPSTFPGQSRRFDIILSHVYSANSNTSVWTINVWKQYIRRVGCRYRFSVWPATTNHYSVWATAKRHDAIRSTTAATTATAATTYSHSIWSV